MQIGQRALPASVQVLPGVDLDDVWERFEIFEALHHSMRICNPMTQAQFDALVAELDPQNGQTMLDVACGYGELLSRCARSAALEGIGIDLSPWMLQTAAASVDSGEHPHSSLSWILGEARDYLPAAEPDIVACLGAEWIWHGFNGTVRALAGRVRPGGLVAVGAARLKTGCDPEAVSASHGRVETLRQKEAMLAAHGLTIVNRIDPDDDAWDAYLGRTQSAVKAWANALPGRRAEEYVDAQREWAQARERDREIIAWSAWVARSHTR